VYSSDPHVDPVGSMVGSRGVRVNTVSSELGGEKIDIIEWNEDPAKFIKEALQPAKTINISVNDADKTAIVEVTEDQQSLAIGKGGQNVRLAAKLTGWRIDIRSIKGEILADVASEDFADEVQADETNFKDISNLNINDDVAPEFRDQE
jgi:N utilization substance protein A